MGHSILVRLASYALRLGLLLLAITAAGVMAFGTPATPKQALEDSGAYNTAADRLAKQAGRQVISDNKQASAQTATELATQNSFTPQIIQANTEKAIDNTYGWLEGTTDQPSIVLDLSPYINQFSQSLGDQALQRAQGLPVCTAEQLQQIDPNSVDLFNLPCLPPGIDLNAAKDQAIARVVSSNGFLQNPVLDTAKLPEDAEGKTALDRAENIPQIYQIAMQAPWIFGGLAALSAGLIGLLLRSSWREVIRKLAYSLLGVGAVLFILVALVRVFFWLLSRPDDIAGKLTAGDFQAVVLALVTTLGRAYEGKLLVFAIVYTLVAGVVLLALRFWKHNDSSLNTIK